MTALWSRAFRTPGTCRCISCAATASAVARRPGATGLRGAWAFGSPTSTFVYTTVFAAGLAIDAKAKRNRSGQWDSAFETIQEELRALQRPGHRRTAGVASERDTLRSVEATPSDLEWDNAFKAAGMDIIDDAVLDKRQEQLHAALLPEVLWDLLRPDAHLNGPSLLEWPASTGPGPGSRYNLPPQSLWALESVRLKALRNRATRKKLALQELSVCSLVHNLLGQSEAHLLSDGDLASLSPHIGTVALLTDDERLTIRREIMANMGALETTKKEDWPEDTMSMRTGAKIVAEPSYFQDSDGDFHHIANQLNVAIKKLFEEYYDKRKEPQEIALATAKICHNLLISTAAPNLQTFNILLTGFRKWEQPRLVDNVIRELDGCKIRPDEITCATILNHYAEQRRPEQFSRFVAKMRGAANALMLARPDVTVNEAGNGRLIRISETKVLQKVYPTPMVFDALMHGVLTFAGFERAMDIYFEMKSDGWGLSMVGLSRFLDDCLHRADWQGGLIVWEEIASIKGRIQPELLAKAYAQFLSLCSVSQKPAAFNTVLNDVVKQGYNRKSILTWYKEIRNAIRPQKGYLAPAFTADNLLIAVSGYMKTNEATDAETVPFFEEINADLVETHLHPQQQGTAEHVDPWTAWVEHELGEPIQTKQPYEATEPATSLALKENSEDAPRTMQPQAQGTANEVDPWAVWMEHELRGTVSGEAPPPDDSSVIAKRGKDS
ncbi:hypothetical protein DPSP01_000322 [Paraphaeosphaeria sporulosa]|uniref:Uncharacterized protein n=1 Tax=Paraphaeosphaeria sporulosa TaxID=1460663 RepID=A0A177CYY0_9PLEO|nr:uncharacterized protein CC84DRAFT_1160007 [Paraphaeosphaeria sporulosa]OAG12744.1 hypothetical protein CC84DRAFT_1160007 [Paraphaeosphaeria sporulosa]